MFLQPDSRLISDRQIFDIYVALMGIYWLFRLVKYVFKTKLLILG